MEQGAMRDVQADGPASSQKFADLHGQGQAELGLAAAQAKETAALPQVTLSDHMPAGTGDPGFD